MSFGFSLALICLFLSLGRDGRWLLFYAFFCILSVISLGETWLIGVVCLVILGANFSAWYLLKNFAPVDSFQEVGAFRIILPIFLTLLLEIILAFSTAGLGIIPTLSIGLILGSLAVIASGAPLSQFCGLLMASDGLLVLSAVLSSWGLFVSSLIFLAAIAVLAVVLLPRLAWQKPEPLSVEE